LQLCSLTSHSDDLFNIPIRFSVSIERGWGSPNLRNLVNNQRVHRGP